MTTEAAGSGRRVGARPTASDGVTQASSAGMVADPRPGTRRLRLDVTYDGTDFSGWAAQPGLRTVQGALEAALALVLRLPEARLTVAGRTDAGVHARGQVCHLDVDASAVSIGTSDLVRLTTRLASVLPEDVRVRRVTPAYAGFDARFSAIWRRYAYRICDNPVGADPLERRHVLVRARRLDEAAMNAAAAPLLGEHDFAAFCRRRPGATTIRDLRTLEWVRTGDVLTATVLADAFCHHLVRSLVGCLLATGEARRPSSWPFDVLRTGRRDPGVTVVPARGLTLEEVGYPPDAELASRAQVARAVRTRA
jgi:tRNA pseudouridine38-40 synthase